MDRTQLLIGLAVALFSIGLVGVIVRRNVLVMMMSMELMLNVVNLSFVTFAQQTATSASGKLDGFSVRFYLIVSSVALIGAALDARMIRRGGFTGSARTTRHLTRMCLAMYMATASFFLGQAKLFPDAVRESGVLNVPVLLVIVGLLWSLVRVRYWPRFRRWRAMRSAPALRSTP